MKVRTMCNRDCPDACGVVAEVEDGRVTGLAGDREHAFTRGFLCQRTSRFLRRQYAPDRITRPLLRRGDRQVEISLDEALDLAAEQLVRIRDESGPAAILPYRLGGSLGLLKELTDAFFAAFGPTSVKSGDVCSGAGEAAQMMDFGALDSPDPRDLVHARNIINWGRNFAVSSVHTIPIVREARRRGARVVTVDPIHTRTAGLGDQHLAVRPGGDIALGLAVGRRLFERGGVHASAATRCDHVEAFKALCFSRPSSDLLDACDLGAPDVERLVDMLMDGPTAILVGWGLQRRLRGAATVRVLDALGALSGNLGVRGGGVLFTTVRRRVFDLSFRGTHAAPRVFPEARLGAAVLEAKDPPVRCLWVTCANPVAMLGDSARMAEAMERTEFTVVVDSHPTDTTRRATLVLPTTTMLEDDDLLGSYGHHFVGVSRPVVAPPPGVLTDLELMQGLARRLGLEKVLEGTHREWKERLLAGSGLTLADLEAGPAWTGSTEVLFEREVPTATGRVNLIHELPPEPRDLDGGDRPLWLFSNSVEQAQASQWAADLPDGPVPATLHPRAARGLPEGAGARLVSAIGSLDVRLVHDERQREDVVLVPKGGHFDRGQCVNALIPGMLTDQGEGAAYLDVRVRLEP